jgi:sarcosine oxidase, subunit gamma
MTATPRLLLPLSPMHEELENAKPQSWGRVGDMPVVLAFATPADEAQKVRKLAIADTSALPRLTLKGPQAKDLLISLGASAPEPIFSVFHSGQSGLAARTGTAEFFVEDGPKDNLVVRLHEVLGPFGDQKPGVYRVLRCDASMFISGDLATEVFMQTCGYDFRNPGRDKMVFTRVAGVSCSILPRTIESIPLFQIWCDGTLGIYLWETLLEIAHELGGGPAGLANFYPQITPIPS